MDSKISNFRHSIRLFKNDLIQTYYNFRINTIEDPYKIRLRIKPYRILFIISHMRSGSSLLTHILNSNSEILGYGETHIQYSSESDFKKLMTRLYWYGQEFRNLNHLKNLKMNHKYVLDKVLHNNKFLDEEFLISENIYSIFLIREPQRTLNSIMELKPHWSQEKTLNYYCERLSKLENYAEKINNKERSLLITHDQLLNHTNSVFKSLKNFLVTEEGFSEEYQILKTTGMRDVGDHKGSIKAGHIVRTPRKLENKIAQDLVEKARESFNHCSTTLSQYCSTVEI